MPFVYLYLGYFLTTEAQWHQIKHFIPKQYKMYVYFSHKVLNYLHVL